jgi:diguanylate cyclase (GGDEF)-like protein
MRVQPGSPLAAPSAQGPRRAEPREPSRASAPRALTDTASIMGVPQDELTPNVQTALLTLMGEVDQLRRETDSLRGMVRDLEDLADRDVLLPVMNRRAFTREVGKALALANRHGAPSALLFFDLNGFKPINDAHGHAAGDAALLAVAETLNANLRESDSVGRMGGDEFAVLLALTGFDHAETKAEALAASIAALAIPFEGETLTLSAAWGAAPVAPGLTAEAVIAQADAAMYLRKDAR